MAVIDEHMNGSSGNLRALDLFGVLLDMVGANGRYDVDFMLGRK